MQNVVSALFLPPAVNEPAGALLTGMPKGEIYVWKGTAASQIVPAHKPGPEVTLETGQRTFGGVRCLRLRDDGRVLLSGGADGCIHTWDVADGQLSRERLLHTYRLPATFQKEVRAPPAAAAPLRLLVQVPPTAPATKPA